MHNLQNDIERFYAAGPSASSDPSARAVFQQFRYALIAGEIRSAEKVNGLWQTNAWVKKGILLGFRIGALVESGSPDTLSFVDKDTYPVRHFSSAERIRIVPGGSSVRV